MEKGFCLDSENSNGKFFSATEIMESSEKITRFSMDSAAKPVMASNHQILRTLAWNHLVI